MENTITLLSYNIHKGIESAHPDYVLLEIRKSIRIVHADLLFLQEVHGEHAVRGNQFEYLADQVWPYTAYGKNAVYEEGNHGNAILSKYPILSWENINVSTNPFERRGILHAQLNVPGLSQPLHAFTLHLNLLETGRRLQIESLCEHVKNTVPPSAPLLIAGDFNDWRQRISRSLESELGVREAAIALTHRHFKTFPAKFPFLALDRIYYKNLEPLSIERHRESPWDKLSDHLALSATFGFS